MYASYFISNSTNPYYNLSTELSLFKCVEKDEIILFLWQNENTIVIGKNQNVFSECLVEDFLKSGGNIARRLSGGGAVYHDLGNLNYSIISYNEVSSLYKYSNILCSVFKSMGFKAEFNGKNDILIDGKKVSGNAFFYDGDICCQHGTILISSNASVIERFLTPEISKLQRNHVKSISSRVANLCDFKAVSIDDVKAELINEFKAQPLLKEPSKEEILKNFVVFSDSKWIYGDKR